MEASDLINYKEQVATIEAALQEDPSNEELLTLKAELLELITLTETLLQQEQEQQQQAAQATAAAKALESSSHTAATAAAASSSSFHSSNHSPQSISGSGSGSSTPHAPPPSTTKPPPESNQPIYQPPAPVRHWSAGDRCRALYQDGKFYEAKILAVGGGGQVYTVAFKGYESSPPALVGPQDLKAIYDPKKHQKHDHNKTGAGAATTATAAASAAVASSGARDGDKTLLTQKKRGPDDAGGDGGPKKKKVASEQVQKQMAWQNFAKGGAKKAKGPVLKKSIFATPDNPEGKVGVVGSGKGMTSFQQRGKHIYGNAPQSR
ncbi:hypothetical protein KVV02_001839 [Mortierella alpina]|uniref:Tudor domain-containing protein n=1 Tax=Mortierella alpina TaxID=64518 RepID=A0A9P8CXP4_MORAP|nr:hypothetical protein KVV02_001839 [Mortierella alpina]